MKRLRHLSRRAGESRNGFATLLVLGLMAAGTYLYVAYVTLD